jgi:hypothetical protein
LGPRQGDKSFVFGYFIKMVKIKVTERIAQFIDEAISSNYFSSDADALRASKEDGGIEIAELDRVCRKWREKNPAKKIWLHELTKGSEVYFPPKAAPVRVRIVFKKILFSVSSDNNTSIFSCVLYSRNIILINLKLLA